MSYKGFDGKKDGKETRFSSTHQPKKRRQSKLLTVLKKGYGIEVDKSFLDSFSREQIQDLMELVMTMDPREMFRLNTTLSDDLKRMKQDLQNHRQLEKLDKGRKVPQVLLGLLSAINKQMAVGRSDTLQWMIEYLYGRAAQPISGTIATTDTSADAELTDEDIEAQIKAIDKTLEEG
jgi:hypothetical protein